MEPRGRRQDIESTGGTWPEIPNGVAMWEKMRNRLLGEKGVAFWKAMEGETFTVDIQGGNARVYDVRVNERLPESVFTPN